MRESDQHKQILIISIQQFYNIYSDRNMAEVKDSRVEFFNSESSFGSSSNISTSRIDFQCDQLVLNTENIFQTLGATLKPRSDLTSLEELKHIVYRAKLLANDSIPICIGRLSKNNRKAHIQDLNQCSEKLEKLMTDYESLTGEDMTYQEFYNIYGDFGNFHKKTSNRVGNASFKVGNRPVSPTYIVPEPDVVNIVNVVQSSRAKATNYPKLRNMINPQRNPNDQKEIQMLQQEIVALKKNLRDKESEKQQYEKQLRLITNKRMLNLIRLSQDKGNQKVLGGLEQQFKVLKEAYQKQVKANNIYKQKILAQQKIVDKMQEQIKSLRELLNSNQRLNSSQMSEKSNNNSWNKSGESRLSEGDPQRLEKINKNLEYENSLLKNELQKSREVLFKINKKQEKWQENQLQKLQIKNDKKSKQIAELLTQLDRCRIENIRLADKLQKTEKSVELVKLQATNAKNNAEIQRAPLVKSNSTKDNNRLDDSRSSCTRPIVQVQEYIGDGNQQYPYYQFLNKEFRIRFRRACLKDKQLLYKASGLEIGIITQYLKPNKLKQCLYLSNFCDKQVIKNLKFKLTNSKNNRTQLQESSYQKLEIGEQIKNYVTCSLNNYPIGCTVLICQYDYYSKHEEIRVLLPVNVFKMLIIKPRDSDFDDRNCKRQNFAVERKIGKDFDTIASYFKGGKVTNNQIQCTIQHEHTNTRFLYDVAYADGQLQVRFEHKFGDVNVSQYIMKSICFLLRKEQGV